MRLTSLNIGTRLYAGFGLALTSVVGMTVAAGSATDGSAQAWVIGCGAVATLACAAGAWWTVRGVVKPLRNALDVADRFSAGDLTGTYEASGNDEFGRLLKALQEMNERMFKVVSQVRAGTTTVASTSSQISRDNKALSDRTENQVSSLEQTASSMKELIETVRDTAGNAQEADKLVVSASDRAHQGSEVVTQVVQTMGSIKDSSRKIVDIISLIDGIAFQTNILALNAAVEAARAGEQGRGFAVVAAEVRTLAQRSASAAKEIKQLIDDSVEKVEAGNKLADDAGKTMEGILASVHSVADIIRDISSASQEQNSGIDSINKAIAQIDDMTQKNSALVKDASKTATALNEQAVSLMRSVSGFNLGSREYGNEEEAVALVKAGVELYRSAGKDALLDEINKLSKGRFIDRDLYLLAIGINDTVFVAHGSNPRVLGLGPDSKDTDGKPFVRDMTLVAKNQGSGWVDYKWAHPVTNENMQKLSYVERAGDLAIACGIYKT